MGRGAMVDAQTQALVNQLSAGVTAAVFTPARKDGCIDIDALADYSSRLASSGLAGLAVWAHTGRGLRLDGRCRKIVIDTIRQATTLPLVAGVGVPSEVKVADTNEGIAATVAMAHAAGESGTDALMVYPPAFAAGQGVAERASTVRRIHSAVAALGLPVLGFLLYERAGGVSYRDAELAEILCIDGVVGMKVATLDQAIRCQDVLATIASAGKLAVTGEDRMFGPSLMWGAQTSIVGIAAGVPHLTIEVQQAWQNGDTERFIAASHRLDAFSARIFGEPRDGYIQRMMWAAVGSGLLPAEFAHDPYGGPNKEDEKESLISYVRSIG